MRTAFTYTNGVLSKVTEPAGRWLQIIYASGRITRVQAGYTIGSTTSITQDVNYVYTTFGAYTVLARADYSDGTSASYTYQSSNVTGGAGYPLIKTCNDVRYPGPMKQIAYDFVAGGFYGQLWKEKHIDGTVVVTLAISGNTRTETRGDAPARTFTYGTYGTPSPPLTGFTIPSGAPYLLASVTDFKGNKTYFSYDAKGYLNKMRDANLHVTSFTRAAKTGNLLSLTHPGDGSSVIYAYTDQATGYYLSSVKDELGNETTYGHDANMNVNRTDYPDGGYETFTYNGFGQMLTHRNRSGGTETFGYNTRALLITYTPPATPSDPNPGAHPTRYDYDVNDHLSHVTDPRTNQTTFYHNQRGQLTIVQHPDGSMRGWVYNDDGTVQNFNDENGHLTTYTYDAFKRLMRVTTPQRFTGDTALRTTYFYYKDGGTASNDYSHTDSNVVRLIPPSYDTNILNSYDQNRRKTSVLNGWGTPAAAMTTFEYDAVGNLTRITEPNGQPGGISAGKHWDYTYDGRNRLVATDDPTKTNHNVSGDTVTITYDVAGNKKTVRRANNQVTTYNTYDPMNRLTQMTVNQKAGLDAVTNYTWWPSGSLHTMQDPKLNTYTYDYDVWNRLITVTYPGGTTETKTYDIAGNLYQFKNRNGKKQTFVYDNRNRETSYSWDDGLTPSRTLGYDDASNMTDCDSTGVGINFTYYNDNTLKSQEEWTSFYGDNVHRTVTYTYDANGNRALVTYPSNVAFGYVYTGRQQIDNIYRNGYPTVPWVSYAYDSDGNRTSRSTYYGANTTYDPADALNRIKGLTHTFAGGRTARFDYAFDEVSRIEYEKRTSSIASGFLADGFNYDLNDQTGAFMRDGTSINSNDDVAGGTAENYTFDANGNRTVMNSTSYTTNALNQYSAITGLTAPGYDLNGNLISYNNWTYEYDAMNRLTKASAPGGSTYVVFHYDGLNRQVTRNYNGNGLVYYSVWDGWNLIEEYSQSSTMQGTYLYGAGGELVRRWYGPYADAWYHQDGRGNTSHVSADGGALLESYTYDLYGKPTVYDPSGAVRTGGTAYNVSHLFTGQRWIPQMGPSGMYDYRNRFMFPEIGRFVQADPIGFGGGNHLYRYCENDPGNRRDPLGLTTFQVGLSGTFHFIGVIGSFSFGIATDNHGNIALYGSPFGGVGPGVDPSVGVAFFTSNAETVYGLRGAFVHAGGEAHIGVGAQGEVFSGRDAVNGKLVVGGGVVIGAGAGGGAYGGASVTGLLPIYSTATDSAMPPPGGTTNIDGVCPDCDGELERVVVTGQIPNSNDSNGSRTGGGAKSPKSPKLANFGTAGFPIPTGGVLGPGGIAALGPDGVFGAVVPAGNVFGLEGLAGPTSNLMGQDRNP